MLRLLVNHGPPHDLIQRFGHDHAITAHKRDMRVGSRLDVLDQVGVEHEGFATQTGQLNHCSLTYVTETERARSNAGESTE